MKNYLLAAIICSGLFSIDHPAHESLDNWNILQGDEYEIWIGWLDTPEIDWARTISTLPYSIDKISKMIENKGNYYNIFDRVTESKEVGDDMVYIRIDMPFPISDRDYVVRYYIEEKYNDDILTNIQQCLENSITILEAYAETGSYFKRRPDEAKPPPTPLQGKAAS